METVKKKSLSPFNDKVMQQRPKMAFWVLLGDHAPRRLELPPLAALELHEARHEGAAGEAVGPVQPPDPRNLSRLPSTRPPRKGTSFSLSDGERPRRSAMSAARGPYRGEPSPSAHAAPERSRSPAGR